MARRALSSILLAGLVLPASLGASARIARRSGLSCTMCHVDARGRLGLTAVGERHRRAGLRASLDPELTVPGELRPLSPGGARMLHRRVRELGRRLFQMRDLGRSRKACQSCHAGGEGLASDLVGSYPRYRANRQAWTTLEGAIQDCLEHRVGSEPLRPGSRSAIALQLYVREVAGQPAHPYLDDAAWGMATRPARGAPAAPEAGAFVPEGPVDSMDSVEEPAATEDPELEAEIEDIDELEELGMGDFEPLDGDL